MAVTAPASMSKIVTEFGGPGNLKAYNKGGLYVPNTPTNAAVSTDPNLLAISQFVGAAASVNPAVAMPDVDGFSQGNSGVISCGLFLYADGMYMVDTNLTNDPQYAWLTAGSASDVQVYVTNNGHAASGTFGTWLDLSQQRSWSISTGVNGGISTILSLTFRNKNTLAQLDTATAYLECWRGTPV